MPTRARADAVLGELSDNPLSAPALGARVDLRRGQLDLLLKVLAVEGAVRQVQGGWVATGQPWDYDEDRYTRIAAARVAEQEAMLDYEALGEGQCRMAYLTASLDDPASAACGRCDTCAGPWYRPRSTTTAQRPPGKPSTASGCPSIRGPSGRWECYGSASTSRAASQPENVTSRAGSSPA